MSAITCKCGKFRMPLGGTLYSKEGTHRVNVCAPWKTRERLRLLMDPAYTPPETGAAPAQAAGKPCAGTHGGAAPLLSSAIRELRWYIENNNVPMDWVIGKLTDLEVQAEDSERFTPSEIAEWEKEVDKQLEGCYHS